jgi:hypothetical protein
MLISRKFRGIDYFSPIFRHIGTDRKEFLFKSDPSPDASDQRFLIQQLSLRLRGAVRVGAQAL